MLLGLVAYRAGEKLEHDPVAGRVTNVAKADEDLSRKYRKGWGQWLHPLSFWGQPGAQWSWVISSGGGYGRGPEQ